MERSIHVDKAEYAAELFGSFDVNAKRLEKAFGVTFSCRDSQIHVIGDMKRLHPDLQDTFSQAEAEMAANTGLILNVAVNYGGRLEITQAARKVAEAVRDGQIRPEDISEATLAQYLYTEPENDVDLLIRPGADKRVSNFLLWQMAYAEFWYTQLCWPDFSKDTLVEAILSFQGRERRFGGLK